MSEIYKRSLDNQGDPVITDGANYVGFTIDFPKKFSHKYLLLSFDNYVTYNEKEVKTLGIDKIYIWEVIL